MRVVNTLGIPAFEIINGRLLFDYLPAKHYQTPIQTCHFGECAIVLRPKYICSSPGVLLQSHRMKIG